MIDDWVRDLCAELGLPDDAIDVAAVLDLARDAAHNVERPAAPVTTYLVGYAAGLRASGAAAADPRSAADLTRAAAALARNWRPAAGD